MVAPAPRTHPGSGARAADPRELHAAPTTKNLLIARSIVERWAEGDTAVEWADAGIDFCGPDLRSGHGIDHMARTWKAWVEATEDFDVVPDQFLDAGNGEVLVPAHFVFGDKKSDAPRKVRLGVILFRLSRGKVARMSVLIDTEQDLERPGAIRSTKDPRVGSERDSARTMWQENLNFVGSILERWAEGRFAVSEWADARIEFCGADFRHGRGIAAMASLWHGWLGTMEALAVVPERFEVTGEDQVLVLARFSCGGKTGPVEEFGGVILFVLDEGQVVRLSLFTNREESPQDRVPGE